MHDADVVASGLASAIYFSSRSSGFGGADVGFFEIFDEDIGRLVVGIVLMTWMQ